MKQQREVLRKEKETAEKIAARAFAQSYLADLVPTVFGTLSDNGYFYDPVERGRESSLNPIMTMAAIVYLSLLKHKSNQNLIAFQRLWKSLLLELLVFSVKIFLQHPILLI